FFSSRRRHTRFSRDWSSDVCSSDLGRVELLVRRRGAVILCPTRIKRGGRTMNRWQIGDVTITRIIEVEAIGGTRFILPQATPEAVQPLRWMVPHFATEAGRLIMSIHALVIDTGSRRIIVDTCIGNDKERKIPSWNMLQGSFLADLEAAGYPRDSIDTVLCTHLHVDHVGWNTMLVDGKWVPT